MIYNLEKKYKEVLQEFQKEADFKNRMSVPKIEKVVINTGTGSVKDGTRKELIEKHLAFFTGQKASKRPAKKSIATFKLREGVDIGYKVTLRGKRMYDFLNKLIFIAIPRQRDFRGLEEKSVDESGNLTIGLKDHLVFPEMLDEDIRNAFGFSITVVTTAKNKEIALKFLKAIGFPFKK